MFSFRPHERLKKREDFLRARREGTKRTGRLLLVWTLRRGETPARAARLGIVVGRKHGGAVQRNLFKRRVREIFRLNKEAIPRGWDLVVMPKAAARGQDRFPPAHDDLRADFLELTRSLPEKRS